MANASFPFPDPAALKQVDKKLRDLGLFKFWHNICTRQNAFDVQGSFSDKSHKSTWRTYHDGDDCEAALVLETCAFVIETTGDESTYEWKERSHTNFQYYYEHVPPLQPKDIEVQNSFLKSTVILLAVSDLGVLGGLPTEILLIIIEKLDIWSVFQFKNVNRQAQRLVQYLPTYQNLVRHSLPLVHALLNSGLATFRTLLEVHGLVYQQACDRCGAAASVVDFLYCKRLCPLHCCFGPLGHSPFLDMPHSASSMLHQTTGTPLIFQFLSTYDYINYGELYKRKPKVRITQAELFFVLEEQFRHKGKLLDTNGVVPNEQSIRRDPFGKKLLTMRDLQLPYFSEAVVDAGSLMDCSNLTCRALNPTTHKPMEYLSCKGCLIDRFRLRPENTTFDLIQEVNVYTPNTFLTHFKSCSHAQSFMAETIDGSKSGEFEIIAKRLELYRLLPPKSTL
jgi:hypothetical protein